jgi:hypothetical protein
VRAIACILIAWNIFMFARVGLIRDIYETWCIFLVFQMSPMN